MSAASSGQVILEAKGLVKRFGGLVAVNQTDFSVREGQMVGVIGPNGAGKSTLFNLLAGAFRPTQGTISVLGHDTTRMSADRVCKLGLARTFQIVRPLRRLTVLENVMVGALVRTNSVHEARKRASAVVERVGLGQYADMPATALSLANLKRMEVARALATRPRILLLDEMMAGLNSAELDNFIALVRTLNQEGLTIVIVEHVIEAVVSLCERITVMSYGQKIAEGPPDQVLADPQVIAAYLGDSADDA